jgi:5-methylcytosine-specific restriction endonuclease McrA
MRAGDERTQYARQPIPYAECLKLLWQVSLECVSCHRRPPDVKLHIDHIVPASRGGSSKRPNLQFLCASDKLKKSARIPTVTRA